jgi:hypothetical protein
MTAPESTTPVSVNYTGRDYAALREALIERVKDRTSNAWKGDDPNDFGLAIIEAFAYMGDLLNFYIDRVANESYLLTATQRESLLNLASMYGYTPSNYVSALTSLSLSNNEGFNGAIKAAIIEEGTINSVTKDGYAKLIVPNDHPFEAGGTYDTVIVGEIPDTVSSSISGTPVTYTTSVYNGTFTVEYVGYETFGTNVIWYRPASDIGSITIDGTVFTVTLPAEATTDTFVNFAPQTGQKVVIDGVTSTGDGYDGKWIIDTVTDATATTPASFTIESADAVADIDFAYNATTAYVYSYDYSKDIVAGQTVSITGVKSANNTGGTANTHFNFNSVSVVSAKDTTALVSGPVGTGTNVTFRSSKALAQNDIVSVYGIVSSINDDGTAGLGYNVSNAVVSAVNVIENPITIVTPNTGSGVVIFTSPGHNFVVGDFVTISGVTPDVYNMDEARIVSTSTNTFSVNAAWNETFDAANSTSAKATLYTFTVASTCVETTASGETGTLLCKQFTVAPGGHSAPGAYDGTSVATAAPLVGGTATVTSAEVYYANLPVLTISGAGYVQNIGSVTVPEGSQVYTEVEVESGIKKVIFSTQSDVVIPFKSSAEVLAVHGEDISLRTENAAVNGSDINGELLGYSSGRANQTFSLKEVTVPTRSVQIFIKETSSWEEWTQVEHLQDYGPTDKVFQVDVASTGVVSALFGDGVSGKIPVAEKAIKSVYISGGGVIGNVGASTLTKWDSVPGEDSATIRTNVTIDNLLPATGGSDPESNDSIRYNAPRALRTLNRAVTIEDFSNLALTVGGVDKAKAVADSRSSVTVYIAPVSTDAAIQAPGYVGTADNPGQQTTQMEELTSIVDEYLSDKVQIGTSVTILPPIYTAVEMEVLYSPLPNYSDSVVAVNIQKSIVENFAYSNLDFEEVITPEEIEFKLRQVDGVANVRLQSLHRDGGTGRTSLVAFPEEIFVFLGSNVTVTKLDTVATLNSVTFSNTPTISPAFNVNVKSYTLTFGSGVTSTAVTPTTTSADSSVSINDVSGTSGSATTVSGLVNGGDIIVTVTAEDGMTVTPYRFKVVIS